MTNKRKATGPYEALFKRPLGFLLSFAALMMLSPLLLALSAVGAVKMRGNPFFTQERPGRYEKVFRLIKFRTMSNAHDANGRLLPDDQRLNAYGKFLRSTSLDELPELLLVLTGKMSLVGPRPLPTRYLSRYTPEQMRRHEVRPGITGWAQIHGRNTLEWESRFAHDVWYVDHRSLWLDAKILFLTVATVFTARGIAEEGEATMSTFKGDTQSARQTQTAVDEDRRAGDVAPRV